ncbi:tRNA 2-thiouridine(34) synthase MnmA [Candidatus Symbiobacter mobilis]|uniref:tRNA-specific 2-thiouridylase MnmA n=1 Tax=Candidatus Symbiobacter mobilis CR TaxID=946483 RepID=U5N9X0_9BURK|nr:tRNA 2-thiouridine(34) synthase MnmA [Candidatus Symbiobacter mobilis]AGX87048.1 tRNA-specific 2-thiouridylase [Candidatus Symbiobacter mobilis CR]
MSNDLLHRPARVVVGLSGGVDSAVAAWLLKKQGHEVIGVFMKNWEDDDTESHCAAAVDFVDAAAVADVLDIDIAHVNFSREYRERVFADFLEQHRRGRTPNPDVLCNAEIKFKAFLEHAMAIGADAIATGHYARVRHNTETGWYELLRGVDPSKDQSYFLYRLTQQQLSKAVFPVGGLLKTEVRRIAREIGLPNAAKKDSTGICFIGERHFRTFLTRYLPLQRGPIRDENGVTLGEHCGLPFYTLGQRKGLGIGGVRGVPEGASWYVARKDIPANTLWVVQGHEHPWLLSDTLHASDASWIAPPTPGVATMGSAKTRYRQRDVACTLRAAEDGRFTLHFAQPQWAVTPGQSAVVYDGEVCLGGGVIDAAGTTPSS